KRTIDLEDRELAPLNPDMVADTTQLDQNPTLLEVLDRATREKGTSPSTLANYRSSIKRLEAIFAPKRLQEWTATDLRQFKEHSFVGGKAHGTIAKDLSAFRVVFRYAHKNGLRPDNPAALVTRPAKVARYTRDNFNEDQINRLLSNVPKGNDKWWLMRIALYCGMREGEVAQLRDNDTREVEEVWVIDVNAAQDEYGSKNLKRTSTARLIPVPQQLLDDGVVEFAHRHKGRIFGSFKDTEGKRAAQRVSRWFTDYRRSLGIEPAKGRKLDFHSFRHTFKTKARTQMSEEWSDAVTGHSNGKLVGRRYGTYELQTMKEQLDRIEWPIPEAP